MIWESSKNLFLQKQTRQTSLRRLISARRIFRQFKDEIIALAGSEAVSAFDAYLHDLGHSMGKVAKALGNSTKRDGRLNATIHVRNREAEEERASKRRPDLYKAIEEANNEVEARRAKKYFFRWIEEHGQVHRPQVIPMGVCAGFRILELRKPSKLLRDAIDVLNGTETTLVLNGLEGLSNLQLHEMIQVLRSTIETVHLALGLLQDLKRFTEPRNLSNLAAWANRDETISGKYKTNGRTLADEMGNHLKPRALVANDDAPALSAMMRAITE